MFDVFALIKRDIKIVMIVLIVFVAAAFLFNATKKEVNKLAMAIDAPYYIGDHGSEGLVRSDAIASELEIALARQFQAASGGGGRVSAKVSPVRGKSRLELDLTVPAGLSRDAVVATVLEVVDQEAKDAFDEAAIAIKRELQRQEYAQSMELDVKRQLNENFKDAEAGYLRLLESWTQGDGKPRVGNDLTSIALVSAMTSLRQMSAGQITKLSEIDLKLFDTATKIEQLKVSLGSFTTAKLVGQVAQAKVGTRLGSSLAMAVVGGLLFGILIVLVLNLVRPVEGATSSED